MPVSLLVLSPANQRKRVTFWLLCIHHKRGSRRRLQYHVPSHIRSSYLLLMKLRRVLLRESVFRVLSSGSNRYRHKYRAPPCCPPNGDTGHIAKNCDTSTIVRIPHHGRACTSYREYRQPWSLHPSFAHSGSFNNSYYLPQSIK